MLPGSLAPCWLPGSQVTLAFWLPGPNLCWPPGSMAPCRFPSALASLLASQLHGPTLPLWLPGTTLALCWPPDSMASCQFPTTQASLLASQIPGPTLAFRLPGTLWLSLASTWPFPGLLAHGTLPVSQCPGPSTGFPAPWPKIGFQAPHWLPGLAIF